MSGNEKLPLGRAALDQIEFMRKHRGNENDTLLITQSRAALSLTVRVAELETANKALREALQDCFEWFDARADVDHVGDPMRPFPNAEAIQREHVLATLAAYPATTTPESV